MSMEALLDVYGRLPIANGKYVLIVTTNPTQLWSVDWISRVPAYGLDRRRLRVTLFVIHIIGILFASWSLFVTYVIYGALIAW
jgi:hypothetical protein